MVAQAGEYADRLIEEGRDSFDRGLMRLSDYSEHLSIALQLKTTLADMRQDDRAKIAALSERASLLETAAAQLREFNEPASQGWVAETAQAQLLAAEARGELAQARQDRIDLAQAERRRSELAMEHFELRRADLDVGLTTLQQVSWAATHLAASAVSANADPQTSRTAVAAALTEYRDQLDEIATQTRELNDRGAGLGRADRLQLADFQLAKTDAILAHLSGDQQAVGRNFAKAEELARDMFNTKREFYETGTASLNDLTRAWTQRQDLHAWAEKAGYKLPNSVASQQQSDLKQLVQVSQQVDDLRGRNAADVTAVYGLNSLQQLASLRPAAGGVPKPPQPYEEAPKSSPGATAPAPAARAPGANVVTPTPRPVPAR
jgi:hypothetical protein